MSVHVGSEITLDIEKPAAGGRMLARFNGQVVLVWGAIPGERVRARVERVGKGVLFAESIDIVVPSPDRRDAESDWRCGGSVFGHVAYDRQVRLKAEIIRDTLGRIGHVPLASAPDVLRSPERGYRMRARLHANGGRLGFYREGSHELCDPASTGQLHERTLDWIASAERLIARHGLSGLAGVEIAENVSGEERACHLELQGGVEPDAFVVLAEAGPVTGISASYVDRDVAERVTGTPSVTDRLRLGEADGALVTLQRDVRAFFQANRFLLDPLVRHVVSLVSEGPVVDLYAGVGLFGLSVAAMGIEDITLVEGDPVSGADLKINAQACGSRVHVKRSSVEDFLQKARHAAAVIVDPPRTGLSKEALQRLVRLNPGRIVYVSCDIATFARDTRGLLDAGYDLAGITGFDLFPGTAHVETVASFARRG
ncbi:MAG: class I SAM-dependent RNA methyltransferase [Acidobacteria bacterium]|nr:class I SAM-dependent RNA methyltransferase [Acidobacteriota bacterium]